MLHGQLPSRWRSFVNWTLFLLLLAGMAVVLENVLPPQPRWTISESLFAHGITPDNRAVITTKLRPIETGDDSRPPLQAWDLANGHELARLFPDGFDMTYKIRIPPDGKDALIHMQPQEGGPWELHFLDTTRFTTRKLPVECPSAETYTVQKLAKAPLAIISPSRRDRQKPLEQSLLDLESGAILERGFPDKYATTFIVNEPMIFFATRLGTRTELNFRDRRKPEAETITLDDADLGISDDEKCAVTREERKPGQQRLKLWCLTKGTVLNEVVTMEGSVYLSADGAWAMIEPDEVARKALLVPDPTDHGQRAEFWNLREGRRIGTCPWENTDTFDVISVDGMQRLLTFAHAKSEVCLRDLNTMKPIWTRTWPMLDHLGRRYGGSRAMKGYVAFGNDLEMLDLSNGETRHRIPLASSRYRAFTPGMAPEDFQTTLSADGRFAVIFTRFFEKEAPAIEAWVAPVRTRLGLGERSSERLQIAVIELATAKLLLQTRDYSQNSIQSWHLSADGQSLLVNSRVDGNRCALECWDLPARQRWGWILGLPIAFGAICCLTRRTWLRWRQPAVVLPAGQDSAIGVK